MTTRSERFQGGNSVVLEVRDLASGPPGVLVPAVKNVSLEIRRGEWLGIIGPNGSGKTSLVLALAGLWPVLAGSRTTRGERGAPRMVTILQEPATQITQQSVRDEIAFTAVNLGLGSEAADRASVVWAARFGLSPLLDRTPNLLSAGQQQRVLLASALAAEPEVLVADEAAAHLDPDARRMVLEILRERVDAGLALVWVTQDPDEIRCADRLFSLGEDGCGHNPICGKNKGEVGSTAPVPPAVANGPSEGGVIVRIRPMPGGRIAVTGNLEISIGSRGIWAIVGPNGSGKSSLLEAIAGVEPIRGVDIEWREVPRHGPILAGQFPERQIFEELVRSEVSFAARYRGMSAAGLESGIEQMFGSIGLPREFLARRTWELSIGEKRLVSLVATLLSPASLILLDEPTCGIDPARRSAVADWVQMVSQRIPIVVATQDREWIRQIGAIEVPLGMCDGSAEPLPTQNAKSQPKNGLTEPCPSA